MVYGSATRASLLLRIRDPSDWVAWGEFVELYAPLVHAYGMRRGLQDADAADLVQEVLQSVYRAVSRFEYDQRKGSFRGWLLAVTLNEIRRSAQRQKKQPTGSGDTQVHGVLADQPDTAQDDQWDRDYRMNLFHWAAARVKGEFRDATWQAFWNTVVESRPVTQVAEELGISVGAVYIARCRVTSRIREQVSLADSI